MTYHIQYPRYNRIIRPQKKKKKETVTCNEEKVQSIERDLQMTGTLGLVNLKR